MPIFSEQYPSKNNPTEDDVVLIADSENANAIKGSKISAILNRIKDWTNWITTAMIKDGAITSPKINFATFGSPKIGIIPGSLLGDINELVTIDGLGFKPSMVEFTVLVTTSTTSATEGGGAMTETDQYAHTSSSSSGGYKRRSETNLACIILPATTTSATLAFARESIDDDGFTINIVAASTAFDVAYKAYR